MKAMLRVMSAMAGLLMPAVPAAAQTLAVTNARIVTMAASGDIGNGTVLVRDGRIVAVGARVPIPIGARIVDAQGGFVTPGMLLVPTPLAVRDIIGNGGGRSATVDRLSAAYEVADDYNPLHPHVAEARAEGVTTAVLTADPQRNGRIFAGEAALITLAAGAEAIVDRRAALYLSATEAGAQGAGGGLGALRVRLKRAFADARDYRRNPAGFDLARLSETGLSRADMEALGPVVSGQQPLLVEVNRAQAIRNVLQLAREEHIRIILTGASEAWIVAGEIARAGVPVIVDGEMNQALSFEDLNASYENAAKLTQAGVSVAFKPTFSRIGILDRSPRWTAGRAARFGLGLHAALAAVTINPARMFGVAERLGSIEAGKDADLVIWSGDPFETSTFAKTVLIRGVEQPLLTRARALMDRYLTTLPRP